MEQSSLVHVDIIHRTTHISCRERERFNASTARCGPVAAASEAACRSASIFRSFMAFSIYGITGNVHGFVFAQYE